NPCDRTDALEGVPWCDQLLRVLPNVVSSSSKRVKPEGWLNILQDPCTGPKLRFPLSTAFPATTAICQRARPTHSPALEPRYWLRSGAGRSATGSRRGDGANASSSLLEKQ